MKIRALKSVLLMAFALVSTACNPVGFDKFKSDSPITAGIDPVIFPPDVEPPVPPVFPPGPNGPTLSKGVCAADSSTQLLSCMSCIVPPVPVTSQFSKKGEAFFEIMNATCKIPNGSDPVGYVPPTRAELLYRMNRLSPTLYPDTPMTPLQVSVVNALRTDLATQKKFFGGIFYSGVTEPTIAFETYFGIESREARYSFCYADDGDTTVGIFDVVFTRHNSTGLPSKKYLDCWYNTGDWYNCKETPAYVDANLYRNQLRRAMTESIVNPYTGSPAGVQQTCSWEKFEGMNGAAAAAQVKSWLAGGFTIGADIASRRMCSQITAPLEASLDSLVTMAAYRCK